MIEPATIWRNAPSTTRIGLWNKRQIRFRNVAPERTTSGEHYY
jgi:hypothetical protein